MSTLEQTVRTVSASFWPTLQHGASFRTLTIQGRLAGRLSNVKAVALATASYLRRGHIIRKHIDIF